MPVSSLAQRPPVVLPISKHRNMGAHPRLVVEHIATQARVHCKGCVERHAQCGCADVDAGRVGEALQLRGERDTGHGRIMPRRAIVLQVRACLQAPGLARSGQVGNQTGSLVAYELGSSLVVCVVAAQRCRGSGFQRRHGCRGELKANEVHG